METRLTAPVLRTDDTKLGFAMMRERATSDHMGTERLA